MLTIFIFIKGNEVQTFVSKPEIKGTVQQRDDFMSIELIWQWYLLGYRHTMISLICMSTHKASATKCHLEHQAWSGQQAIWALAMALLRRLTLSVLFTTMTTSYQTTCTVSKRTSIKGTHANANLHRVALLHYDSIIHLQWFRLILLGSNRESQVHITLSRMLTDF